MQQLKTNSVSETPFVSIVSFAKIYDYWENMAHSGSPAAAARAKTVLESIEHAKELRSPFSDLSLLQKYEKEVELLFSELFSDLLQENEIRTLSAGFNQVFFNQTSRFKAILEKAGPDFNPEFRGMSDGDFYVLGCSFILQKCFGVNMPGGLPQLLDIPDLDLGIVKTYRGFVNGDFMDLKFSSKSPKLSQEQIAQLLASADDVDLWKKLIPPGSFEMHGFGILTMFDVSADDAISQLKNILITKDALVSENSLTIIQDSLRRLLRIEDLEIGFGAFSEGEFYNMKVPGFEGLLMADYSVAQKDCIFCERSFDTLFKNSDCLTLSNIDVLTNDSPLVKNLQKSGVKSYYIAPLEFGDTPIGFLEIGSATSDALNSIVKRQLQELVPLFSIALKRSIDDYYSNIQAIIKERCTAIHPTVEWRFRQAASRMLKSGSGKAEQEMEEIVFKNVIPLFGQLDIRGSSRYRNEGIKADLSTQLQMAKGVLQEAKNENGLVAFDQLSHVIDKYHYKINESLGAGDEATILNFIHHEIDPVFEFLDNDNKSYPSLTKYLKRIDPGLRMIYEKRKQYELAVTKINDVMGVALEQAQDEAQQVFPHYFEKYKTDGIEYNAYIGQSLVHQEKYHPIHLKNLRIWQLLSMCDIDWEINQLKSTLPVPLEVAPLILVQDNPLDIKFRMDEKQFDVDGAYNVRYEIIKKRIDKALIKGSGDRLTQPGKLAIVYSTNSERNQYFEFFDFLVKKSYILPDVEDLVLEEMDGAAGLRSLRVSMNYDRKIKETNTVVEASSTQKTL